MIGICVRWKERGYWSEGREGRGREAMRGGEGMREGGDTGKGARG